MSPDDFNKQELANGNITPADVSRATRIAQAAIGFHDTDVDGKLGKTTRDALAALLAGHPLEMGAPLTINADGWLVGDGVKFVASHPSWFGGTLLGTNGLPEAVVCHVSDTDPGTALNMAKRRARPFGEDPNDRMASWHASVETEGTIVQMISFKHVAWHAGGSGWLPIDGLGEPNYHSNGIELVGYEKGPFPEKQVLGYARVLRAIVQWAGIDRKYAMINHHDINPTHRTDPGPEWANNHAARVLEMAFA